MALLLALKQLIWMQRFLWELGREAQNNTVIYEDYQGAIALGQFHARTKHIDIQYHLIRECIEKGQLVLEYSATEDMLADALTKSLARDRHWKLLGEMGLQKCNIIKEK
jgi:hypothetical protein